MHVTRHMTSGPNQRTSNWLNHHSLSLTLKMSSPTLPKGQRNEAAANLQAGTMTDLKEALDMGFRATEPDIYRVALHAERNQHVWKLTAHKTDGNQFSMRNLKVRMRTVLASWARQSAQLLWPTYVTTVHHSASYPGWINLIISPEHGRCPRMLWHTQDFYAIKSPSSVKQYQKHPVFSYKNKPTSWLSCHVRNM